MKVRVEMNPSEVKVEYYRRGLAIICTSAVWLQEHPQLIGAHRDLRRVTLTDAPEIVSAGFTASFPGMPPVDLRRHRAGSYVPRVLCEEYWTSIDFDVP
jgi:hypothetical protein